MKEGVQNMLSIWEAMKSYGFTNICGLDKNKCDDVLVSWNLCFNEYLKREPLKVLIVIYISKRASLLMKVPDNDWDEVKFNS